MYAPSTRTRPGLRTPERNNYVFGMMMGEYQFERETEYMNAMRRLINRRVLGYGVVCGLDVLPGSKDDEYVLEPGFALDGWGREIIVPADKRIAVPPDIIVRAAKETEEDEDVYVHAVLCYHECLSDPIPVLAGDCNTNDECAPGTIREQYQVEFRPGRASEPPCECRIPDLVTRRGIDYSVLVRWVSRRCMDLDSDPCICLANIQVEERDGEYHCRRDEIDINCRPIVYTNRRLFDILLCLAEAEPPKYQQRD